MTSLKIIFPHPHSLSRRERDVVFSSSLSLLLMRDVVFPHPYPFS